MPKKPTRKSKAEPQQNPGSVNDFTAGPETISEQLDSNSRVQQAPGDAVAAREGQWKADEDPTEQDIRARAYQMYLERGARDGQDFDDWLRAEHELKRRR